jgi:tRNA threonylcarbamoyladenosine biosynthesis protein TsaE
MHKLIHLSSEKATLSLASLLASQARPSLTIFLQGDLGSGKTTFARGFLRGLNFWGSVKSPTFTLVEEYDFAWGAVYHFDLYRLSDPEELEFIGIREYFAESSIVLVEWPERGKGVLKEPDLFLHFNLFEGDARKVSIEALSDRGQVLIQGLLQQLENLED